MKTGKVIIKDESGLHLRPAKKLCETANNYKCSIKLVSENTTANMKSIISLLGACVKSGQQVEIICDGENEDEAFEAVMGVVTDYLVKI